MSKELCYVVDINDNPLSPTNYNNGWKLLRQNKAKLVSRLPFVIKLLKEVKLDTNEVILGIDTGAVYTGVALVEKCKTKNKILFKGTINHPQDVKKKMELRRGYRRYRRSHKRYRKARFNNRTSSKRKGRIPNSILTNKQEILRVINKLGKFIRISKIVIEDVQIDIRRLVDGNKVYRWQYQKSNRLDNNIRIAVIMRDSYKCKMCGRVHVALEIHHITPRKYRGADIPQNLITLCSDCHKEVTGKEMEYADRLYKLINGKNIRLDIPQRAMQGKTYLRTELEKLYPVEFTYGSDTANKRQDWNIEKSHANDSVCITGLEVSQSDCDIKDWFIKPLRSNKKNKIESVKGFRHRDIIKYTKKNGESYIGYIIALDENKNTCSFTDLSGNTFRRYGLKSCRVVQRQKCINFI